MNSKAVVVALVGSGVLVFVLPYILASFTMAPNGTETLMLVVVLWAACWAASRRFDERSRQRR